MCNSAALDMLFFSDLDKTLVYSGYSNHVCVERCGEKEITYMTSRAVDVFNDLIRLENMYFIPCTLRSYEQTIRIGILQSLPRQILICDNGFSIYENGQLDDIWDTIMQRELLTYNNEEMYEVLRSYYASNTSEITKIKTNRDAFYTLIFIDAAVAESHFRTVCDLIDKSMYRLELQGRKLYVIPKFLDKSIAVKYLIAKYSDDVVITAGDSIVDELFIIEGGIRFLPKHASIEVENSIRTSEIGIMAGEEILLSVYDRYTIQNQH